MLESVDVELDGLSDEATDLIPVPDRHIAGKIGDMGAPACIAALDDDHVAESRHHRFSFLRPACFNTEFGVPGGTSKLGFPATVTVPDLLGYLYCRWLP